MATVTRNWLNELGYKRVKTVPSCLPGVAIVQQAEDRFVDIDLEYYRRRISPEQFKLLMDIVGVEPAPEGFEAADIWYPEKGAEG